MGNCGRQSLVTVGLGLRSVSAIYWLLGPAGHWSVVCGGWWLVVVAPGAGGYRHTAQGIECLLCLYQMPDAGYLLSLLFQIPKGAQTGATPHAVRRGPAATSRCYYCCYCLCHCCYYCGYGLGPGWLRLANPATSHPGHRPPAATGTTGVQVQDSGCPTPSLLPVGRRWELAVCSGCVGLCKAAAAGVLLCTALRVSFSSVLARWPS
jgi:hypothetical protein